MTPDVIVRATPSQAGVDASGLMRLLDAFEADPGIRPHGLIVLRNGFLIADGWWAPFSPDRVQQLYSISKSFTSTAVGFAREEGLLDLDTTVLSYFPELDADIVDPRSRSMKVRHLASMTSGHATETIERASMMDPDDLVRGFLLIPPDAEPGAVFAYNQPCTYTLAAILQRAAGMSLVDYLRPRLLDPLGIRDVSWIERPPGFNLGFSGMCATTDAIARLGELYRRGGVWGDRRLLSEEWVALATSRHIDTPPVEAPECEQGYGFGFWMGRHGYHGDGAFGQFCVVVPEVGLVVAVTSESEPAQPMFDVLWEHVLPAIDARGDRAADAALAARLATLRLAAPAFLEAPASPDDWRGRRFRSTGTEAPVDGVRVLAGAAGEPWRLQLDVAGGGLDVPFAAGRWVSGESGEVPVAATGGWTDSGDLVVEVLFLETPHTLRVSCAAGTGSATATWRTVPLGDPTPTAQHRP